MVYRVQWKKNSRQTNLLSSDFSSPNVFFYHAGEKACLPNAFGNHLALVKPLGTANSRLLVVIAL
jgi:hypothetical protein